MVRRAQMQKQMDISSTKADKLLKKAKKMNNRMFEKGGVKMAEKKSEKPKTKKPSKRLPFGMDEIFDMKKEFKKIPKSMAKGGVGEDPLKGFEFTGKEDKKGNLQIKNKKTGKTSYLLPGGDSVYPSGKKMAKGGTARSNDAKKSRGAGGMIRGLTFRGVF